MSPPPRPPLSTLRGIHGLPRISFEQGTSFASWEDVFPDTEAGAQGGAVGQGDPLQTESDDDDDDESFKVEREMDTCRSIFRAIGGMKRGVHSCRSG